MTYAANTEVPVERSRAELERTLSRYGATSFAYGWQASSAVVMFEAHGRRIQFVLPLPDRDDPVFTTYRHSSGRMLNRTEAAAEKAWEQAQRARWRALNLVVKAKLEAVESGITTFEQEFLAHTMLPSGETVGDWIEPQLDQAYALGTMPPMLALGAGR